MSQNVKTDLWEVVPAKHPFEISDEFGIFVRFADGIRKDRVVLLPSIIGNFLLVF